MESILDEVYFLLGVTTSSVDIETNNNVVKQYGKCKKLCLQQHDWYFSQATIRLDGIDYSNPNSTQFKYRAEKPSDFLKKLGVYSNSTYTDEVVDIKIGDGIYSNVRPIYLKYIADCSETLFSVAFQEYLTYYLASKICFTLTNSQELQQNLQMQLVDKLNKALNEDIWEKKNDVYPINNGAVNQYYNGVF